MVGRLLALELVLGHQELSEVCNLTDFGSAHQVLQKILQELFAVFNDLIWVFVQVFVRQLGDRQSFQLRSLTQNLVQSFKF